MDIAYSLFNAIHDCLLFRLKPSTLFSMFWFMFLIEIPRYYLLELGVIIFNLFGYRKKKRRLAVARMLLYTENPLITILVPGKNEGRHLFKLIQSLREQTYKNFEIIIVDDGSDDDSPFICKDFEKNGYIDKYFRMNVRGGKASAANYGAYHARGKYIVHLDADSSLDRDAVEKILLPFYLDNKIKGVGGCIKVRNSNDTICTAMQALEYLKTIQVGRTVSSSLGIYHIISGAFGAFDTNAIKQVGCWDIGPGLDGDITQKLRKAGFKVCFVNDAICMTNVPTKWYALFKQRLRWSKSLVRFRIRKHMNILFAWHNFSFLNFISNIENILFDCVFNYLWFFYVIQLCFIHTDRLLEIFLIGLMFRYVMSVLSFGMSMLISERYSEELKLFFYLPLRIFYSCYFLRITRLIAHTMEFFFFSSYKDSWNPSKTSVFARIEKI